MNEDRLKAFASVTFDNSFVVRNMKVVQGNKGIFLCMPSRKLPDGTHKDMVHPINQDFRQYLEEHVLKAYEEELKENSGTVSATDTMRQLAQEE
ncbi:MAG: SpoVG family protein [Elusimicrobiaceae bacterium]|nr:SpoVG family protein [Elusimicrobiaceae bacterium]